MSYLPNTGTVIRLCDGRIAIVSDGTPDSSGDEVLFEDGRREHVDQFEGIAEMLIEEPEGCDGTGPEELLGQLRSYMKAAEACDKATDGTTLDEKGEARGALLILLGL